MPSGQGIFLGMSAYLKFQCNPRCDFLRRPSISKKLIKTEGLILVKLTRMSIQIQKCCCTFQMPLIYNRVCWGIRLMWLGAFQF